MKKTKTTIVSGVALFWVALGILVCYGATRLGLGSVTAPGAGFIFFWSGLILVILSFMALTEGLRSTEEIVQETGDLNWVKITGSLVACVIRLLSGEGWFCSDDICPAELLAGLDRTNQLGPIPRRRECGGAGELCDF